jgi:hypothetical protein
MWLIFAVANPIKSRFISNMIRSSTSALIVLGITAKSPVCPRSASVYSPCRDEIPQQVKRIVQ